MNMPSLQICKDSEALAARAADFVAGCAREAIRQRGRFTLVLCGGSTPEKMYGLLAQPLRMAAADWRKTHILFGDERFVPSEDARSNFGMAQRTLLGRVPVPLSQVFPIPTDHKTAAESATAYADELSRFFPTEAAHNIPPCFDLILLGLGEDGHTASLFPGLPALDVEDAWVAWSPPGVLPPPVDRITLTYPVLNAARHVAFLVAGEKKAAVLHDVLQGHATRDIHPAAGVRPTNGTVTWFVDEAVARCL